MKKRLLKITDAYAPQVNGVARTLATTTKHIEKLGDWAVHVVTPYKFPHFMLPGYREIPIAYNHSKQLAKTIDGFEPDYIHVSVEGPLGLAARKYLLKKGYKFTTAYHTKFPEYIAARTPIPLSWSYKFVRSFHEPSSCVMVAIDSLRKELQANGFRNKFAHWSRGVNTELFHQNYSRPLNFPYALYVGRVSHEKNIEQFLQADTHLQKVVIGDGPQLKMLIEKYPKVIFTGTQHGETLAAFYAGAAVFVFPSKTDTFGLVLIEALASGTPVAALPVSSPIDIITNDVGALNDDLSIAIHEALKKDKQTCRQYVLDNFTWEVATDQFLKNLVNV